MTEHKPTHIQVTTYPDCGYGDPHSWKVVFVDRKPYVLISSDDWLILIQRLSGTSYSDIAKDLGLSKSTTHDRAKAIGIPRWEKSRKKGNSKP